MWIDQAIVDQCIKPLATNIFCPEAPVVVLGRSNRVETEVDAEAAARLEVPILRRAGGGGTVVLYPGCLVLSAGAWVRDRFRNDHFFCQINRSVLRALEKSGVQASMGQNGISDLTIGERKFGGTSLFRSRNYLLYQASLIFSCEWSLLEELLPHPSREPQYRAGRDHKSFLTGLEEVYEGTASQMLEGLRTIWPGELKAHLEPDLTEPEESQILHLRRRFFGGTI